MRAVWWLLKILKFTIQKKTGVEPNLTLSCRALSRRVPKIASKRGLWRSHSLGTVSEIGKANLISQLVREIVV